MNEIAQLPINIRVGGPLDRLVTRPQRPYSEAATVFLSALSKALLALPEARQYPDIAAFGYWCRTANLARLARDFDTAHARLGRGLVLHIAPANVPVNFAYSFAFGLLAGNANIVRIPDRDFEQVDVICKEITRLFAIPTHKQVASMNRLVTYPRNDDITAQLSARCQARLIWGGDATVSHLKTMPTHPRCVDIAFADRYSLCMLNVEHVLAADDKAIAQLTQGFFNDVFLMDQNACSSPHLVIWIADGQADVAAAQQRFWSAMVDHLRRKYTLAPIHALDKFAHLCRTAANLDTETCIRHENLVYRILLSELPLDIDKYRGQYGTFFEHVTDSFDCLTDIVAERYQTITCFGIDRDKLVNFVIDQGMSGIDRVVPVGKALDMGAIWDGHNLVEELSRIVNMA